MHFAIYVYDTQPALQEPRPVPLCSYRLEASAERTDDVRQVTCAACLTIMKRIGLLD